MPQNQLSLKTKDEVLREITTEYLDRIDEQNPPDPAKIQTDILSKTMSAFSIENAVRKSGKWRIPDKLAPAQIADILLKLYPIVNIAYGGFDADTAYDVLSIYQSEGPNEGIYSANQNYLYSLIQEYCYTITDRETTETITRLKAKAPRRIRNDQRNLIAVNNGIFDYDAKILMPFDKDYIFISKSRVDYNPDAKNPIIRNPDGTDWDVETWMYELFNDAELANLMWEIIGAVIRPNVPWNKSAWLYSDMGNNGKGTLCRLMRNLAGEGSHTSIKLSDFSQEFMLEPLIQTSAIIVDENDVGVYIDKAANLKAIITNDVIQVNRKFKTPIAFRFKGFMVQCLNELPQIKDKSESFYRRQLFIPFNTCYTGKEREYIKEDYLQRKDVLEYVLWKVLHMNYYKLSEPEICKAILNEYKQYNDPIRQFVEEILPLCVWDLLPNSFLYDLYTAWFHETKPTGVIVGRNKFIQGLKTALVGNPTWRTINDKDNVRTGNKMNKAEPLIAEYNLDKWKNPLYKGNDINVLCHPQLKDQYRGILRYTATT